MKTANPPCPCGSGEKYGSCCRPFHRGGEPPTAEKLMRSRFCAYAMGEAPYLFRTLHPSHPDRARGEDAAVAEIRRGRGRYKYVRLRILDVDGGGEAETTGRVLFHAEIYEAGKERSFFEASAFEKTAEGWRYLSGEGEPLSAREVDTRAPKLSR